MYCNSLDVRCRIEADLDLEKMSSAMFSFHFLFLLIAVLCVLAQSPKRRFEYKLSFKGPHLVQRDNTVPFWEYFGGKLLKIKFLDLARLPAVGRFSRYGRVDCPRVKRKNNNTGLSSSCHQSGQTCTYHYVGFGSVN